MTFQIQVQYGVQHRTEDLNESNPIAFIRRLPETMHEAVTSRLQTKPITVRAIEICSMRTMTEPN